MLRLSQIALGMFLSLAVLDGASAQSQESSPTDTSSEQTAQPPAVDQRGTDQLPFTVKVLPAEHDDQKAEKEEHDRKEKAMIDEKLALETQRIADYTRWLAMFTAFLFGTAVLQAGFFVWQLLEINDQSKLAKKTAEHLRAVERAYVSGGGAPRFEKKQQLVTGADGNVHMYEVISGKFALAVNNHGKTPAEFLEYGYGWCEADAIPQWPTYKWVTWRDKYGAGTQSRWFDEVPVLEGLSRPTIYGRFRYRDIFGDFHSDGFIQEGGAPVLASQPFTISDPDWDLPPKAQWQSLIAAARGEADATGSAEAPSENS